MGVKKKNSLKGEKKNRLEKLFLTMFDPFSPHGIDKST